jgi:hypothetical protein
MTAPLKRYMVTAECTISLYVYVEAVDERQAKWMARLCCKATPNDGADEYESMWHSSGEYDGALKIIEVEEVGVRR